MLRAQKCNEGGRIVGAGDGKSDSIPSKLKKGSFVVPVEHALLAEQLRSKYLNQDTKTANLNQGGGSPVMVSNGEHLYSPKEAEDIHAILMFAGVRDGINSLAPKSKKKFKLKK
jgi:hypothetical protein